MEPQTSSGDGAPDVSALVVDGDESAREETVRLIRTFGARAHAARDGKEALQLIAEVQPDLILCELQLPRLDGFGVVKRLRRMPPFDRIVIVAVSGLSRVDMATTGAAGFDGHVIKPITLEMIARLLDRAVDARRLRDVRDAP